MPFSRILQHNPNQNGHTMKPTPTPNKDAEWEVLPPLPRLVTSSATSGGSCRREEAGGRSQLPVTRRGAQDSRHPCPFCRPIRGMDGWEGTHPEGGAKTPCPCNPSRVGDPCLNIGKIQFASSASVRITFLQCNPDCASQQLACPGLSLSLHCSALQFCQHWPKPPRFASSSKGDALNSPGQTAILAIGSRRSVQVLNPRLGSRSVRLP